jgi:hypothetical protein
METVVAALGTVDLPKTTVQKANARKVVAMAGSHFQRMAPAEVRISILTVQVWEHVAHNMESR